MSSIPGFDVGGQYQVTGPVFGHAYGVISDRDKAGDDPWGMGSDLTIRSDCGAVFAQFEGLANE
ncbi:hypothetical protein AO825_08375 [Pectobacterium brasiliense]|nr:hypothetical protein AO825_08375 [Pectobacterium brasiliense]